VDYPPDPTPLEYLADDAGVGPDALREWLRAEIERRQLQAATRSAELVAAVDERQ
jgi:hypothetical protein